jgi:hypothetical protein
MTGDGLTITSDGHLTGTVTLPAPYTIPCEETHEYFASHVYADTNYAPLQLGLADTATHYDTLGTVVADVQVEHTPAGALQVTGTVRPDLPGHLLAALREPGWLGGDWRRVDGRMRLVALIHHPDKP